MSGSAAPTLEALHAVAQERGGACLATATTEPLTWSTSVQWSCVHQHTWSASAETVLLQRLWCPYVECLLTEAVTVLQIAPHMPSTRGLLETAEACQCQPCESASPTDPTASCNWKCASGCVFEQSLFEGSRVPGFCPSCRTNEVEQLESVRALATARKGLCHRVLLQSGPPAFPRPAPGSGPELRTDCPQLRWHRHGEGLLEFSCIKDHRFAGSIDVINLGGWCPICEQLEEQQPAAAQRVAGRKRARPTSKELELELEQVRLQLRAKIVALDRSVATVKRMRGDGLASLRVDELDGLELELRDALRRVQNARQVALRTLRHRVRSFVTGIAAGVHRASHALVYTYDVARTQITRGMLRSPVGGT